MSGTPIIPSNPLRAITCVVCGEQKGANNHWWLLSVATIIHGALLSEGLLPQLRIMPWTPTLSLIEAYLPACGNSCAQKLSERFFTSKSLEPSRRPVSEPAVPDPTPDKPGDEPRMGGCAE